MRVSLIAALGRNLVLGDGRSLPWHLPRDLRRFRRITLGKPVLMGRRTFESIGRPLPGRTNIVLTRGPWRAEGVVVAPDVAAALEAAWTEAGEDAEAMVIGGGEVYRLFLPLATRAHLTAVDSSPEGSVTFPLEEMFRRSWRVTEEEDCPPGPDNPIAHRYFQLDVTEEGGVSPDRLLGFPASGGP
jgi:dihydrofolate reductase